MKYCDFCGGHVDRDNGKGITFVGGGRFPSQYTVCSKKCKLRMSEVDKHPTKVDPKPATWGMSRPWNGLGNRGY